MHGKLIGFALAGLVIGLVLAIVISVDFNFPADYEITKPTYITITINDQTDTENLPIERSGNIYTLKRYVEAEIIVEKDNIIIDGGNQLLNATSYLGVAIKGVNNVTIRNFNLDASLGGYGIFIQNSSHITVKDNNIVASLDGIWIDGSHGKTESNTINRNSVTAMQRDGVSLFETSNNCITDNQISSCREKGIDVFSQSTNNLLQNNTLTNNGKGIWIFQSPNNTATNNAVHGSDDGIRLMECKFNVVQGNVFENNRVGIVVDAGKGEYVSNNLITGNSFISNSQQVYTIPDVVNVWDSNGQGNFWSDYRGTDSDNDGIGDTPYRINDSNLDNYPLIADSV
jgi:nitrous oxidase accessory protein